MTQTPDNSGSNRLDRIEAILERMALDRQSDREEMARDRQSDREEMRELRSVVERMALDRQSDREEMARDRESDREEMRELRSVLTRLSTRVDNLTQRVVRFEERTLENLTDSARWQSLAGQLLRTLTETQRDLSQNQAALIEGQAEHERRLQRLDDILASLRASEERQERILDYIIRRTNGDNA